MKSSKFLAVAALSSLAALASVAQPVYAGEADLSTQFAQQVQSTRSRADVRAEGVQKALNPGWEPAGSRVAAQVKSAVDRGTVRTQTAQAVRSGQVSRGGELM